MAIDVLAYIFPESRSVEKSHNLFSPDFGRPGEACHSTEILPWDGCHDPEHTNGMAVMTQSTPRPERKSPKLEYSFEHAEKASIIPDMFVIVFPPIWQRKGGSLLPCEMCIQC